MATLLRGAGNETGNAIVQDGGYVLCGSSNSNDGDVSGNHNTYGIYGPPDFWILQIGTTGDLNWQKCIGGTYGDIATCINLTIWGYIVCGYTASNDGDFKNNHGGIYDYGIARLEKLESVNKINNSNCSISLYPNPSHSLFTIEYTLSENADIEVTDVSGRVVSKLSLDKNSTEAVINAGKWPMGMYFYKVVQNDDIVASGKLVKE